MENDILASLARLTDAELLARLRGHLASERDSNAYVVAHLAELDTRDVHLREGYSSLFVYCRDALGLSEWEAYARIEVARTARRFPIIFSLLASGDITHTTVKLLAAHLTSANHRDVLESARGKTKVEVGEIVARLAPKPDVRSSIRRIATRPDSRTVEAPVAPNEAAAVPPAAAPGLLPPPPPAVVKPLSPDRYKLQLTIGGETLEKLRLAHDMLSHAVPCGDDAELLDRALTALLKELAKTRFAETTNPRTSRGRKAGAREPSAHVKRVSGCATSGAAVTSLRTVVGATSVDTRAGRPVRTRARHSNELVPELVDVSAKRSTLRLEIGTYRT